MKKCPRCSSMFADDNMFCEICGAQLIPHTQSQSVQAQATGQQEPSKGAQSPVPSKQGQGQIHGQNQQSQGMQGQDQQRQGYGIPYQNPGPVPYAPEKKKHNPLFFAIPIAAILLISALLFLFRDKLPFGPKDPDTQEAAQQETSGSKKTGTDRAGTEDGQEGYPENGSDKPKQDSSQEGNSTVQADNSGTNSQEGDSNNQTDNSGKNGQAADSTGQGTNGNGENTSYANADINGVDNAYIQVSGTVAQENSKFILKLQKPSSVCAYNAEDDIIQKKKVKIFTLDGTDMEEYLGDTVAIKGKLSADFDGDFSLQPVKTEVMQEAKEETGTSRYQLIQADATWEEAFSDCISRGGTLAQINSEEEFQKVTALIEGQNMQHIHFYLGGRRDDGSSAYYWADTGNRLEGEMLNPEGSSWAASHWMENEPSFTSEGDTELYLNLIYYKDNWVLNDVPSDITQYYPGKTGYICEFDE